MKLKLLVSRTLGKGNQSALFGRPRCFLLEGPQWTVREAENGREALKCIEESKPDVILLDLMMLRGNTPQRRDCLAGHVRLELRNVGANYPFERSRRFPGIQPNSGQGGYSRLSCGAEEAQLGPRATPIQDGRAAAVGIPSSRLMPTMHEPRVGIWAPSRHNAGAAKSNRAKSNAESIYKGHYSCRDACSMC
jgi:hypothetical protein